MKYTLGGASSEDVTVEVNNVLQDTEIHNVFGVIKGFTEPGTCVTPAGIEPRTMAWLTQCSFQPRHTVFLSGLSMNTTVLGAMFNLYAQCVY